MKKKISDLFDYGDEIVVANEFNKMFDPKEIKEITMNKIKTDNMVENRVKPRKISRRFVSTAIAACLVLAIGVTAYAVNFLGIRELLPKSAKELELPDVAVDLVERHDETATADGWSARVTESLCDEYTMLVTVTVTAEDRYILVSDGIPEDPVSTIGLDSNETLAEYAEGKGKTLLFVGASLDLPKSIGDISGGTSWQNISDNELAFLLRVEKHVSAPSFDVVCRVWATEYGSKKETPVVQIPITLTELQSESFELTPVDANSVPGLHIGNARVTVSPLGTNMMFSVNADSLATIYAFSGATCDEISGTQGYFTWDNNGRSEMEAPPPADIEDAMNDFAGENGTWRVQWLMGQGTVSDTLTVHFFGQNDEPMGEVIFKK